MTTIYIPEDRLVKKMGERGWWFTARFLIWHGQWRLLVSHPMRMWLLLSIRRAL